MKSRKIGVVGIKGAWSTEMLAEAVEKRTGFCRIIDVENLSIDLDTGRAMHCGEDITEYDALIIKKIGRDYSPDMLDRLEILRFLSRRGLKIFSDPDKIIRVLDRLSCTVSMKLGGIPMPPTIITEDTNEAYEAVKKFKKSVFKPLFSTKARGMNVISDSPRALEEIEKFKDAGNTVMYIQKAIEIKDMDLGLVFVGGEYLTTYARVKNGDSWNTTTKSGGSYNIFNPSKAVIKLAHKAQAIFGLDFTCVDVVETEDGPYIFEVSAFGGFRGVYESSGIEAAEVYLNHVLKEIKHV